MTTEPTKPAAASKVNTAESILSALAGSATGYISLGASIAGVVIPIGKALISKIESIGQGNVTITFSALVSADQAELDGITATATADLAAINAELVKLGLAPLPAPAPPTAAQ